MLNGYVSRVENANNGYDACHARTLNNVRVIGERLDNIHDTVTVRTFPIERTIGCLANISDETDKWSVDVFIGRLSTDDDQRGSNRELR